MSIYEEKEAKFAEAFAHLVQDSLDSSDSDFDVQACVPAGGATKSAEQVLEPVEKPTAPAEEIKSNSDAVRKDVIEINLIDDDDDCEIVPDVDRSMLDDDEFRLKLMISGKYTQISTTYKTKLAVALKDLLLELEQKGKTLVVNDINDDRCTLSLDESPDSLHLTPGSLLNAIEVQLSTIESNTNKVADIEEEVIDPDVIRVKLQDGHRKHLKEFSINKCDPVIRLKEFWSNEFSIDISSIKICFDGDVLGNDSTLEEVDIEDGCIIDVMVAQNK